jgi:hypothetical protein
LVAREGCSFQPRASISATHTHSFCRAPGLPPSFFSALVDLARTHSFSHHGSIAARPSVPAVAFWFSFAAYIAVLPLALPSLVLSSPSARRLLWSVLDSSFSLRGEWFHRSGLVLCCPLRVSVVPLEKLAALAGFLVICEVFGPTQFLARASRQFFFISASILRQAVQVVLLDLWFFVSARFRGKLAQ